MRRLPRLLPLVTLALCVALSGASLASAAVPVETVVVSAETVVEAATVEVVASWASPALRSVAADLPSHDSPPARPHSEGPPTPPPER